jgi:hypothetical protein
MAGILDLLGHTSIVQHQLDIVDEQIAEIRGNPEYSDVHKDREIKKLELVKAQITEGAERSGIDAEHYEREDDLFGD